MEYFRKPALPVLMNMALPITYQNQVSKLVS
jgi:hypothetical protein